MSLNPSDRPNIFSHELATLSGFSSAQIRRDLMAIGYSGSPVKGYSLNNLVESLNEFIDSEEKQHVAIIGLGQLGRAILNYCKNRRKKIEIVASFDKDPQKTDQVILGTHCYGIDKLEKIIKEKNIRVVILAIPAEEAQEMAERIMKAGIRGILNYAPTNLYLDNDVFVENRDMILAVEKVAYFSRKIDKEGFVESLS